MRKSLPLDRAWIRWCDDRTLTPSIKVIEVGQKIDKRYCKGWGSPSGDFRMAGADQQVTLLFAKALELILFHGLDANVVHQALLPIQEYRACLLGNLVLEDR
ncbi:hypothetical protein [Sphingomonas sp.]|uniref:hypothetical protein n=1 Tax=Sphingomonas sp. TaxID=28214 RepID=UPI003B00F9B5